MINLRFVDKANIRIWVNDDDCLDRLTPYEIPTVLLPIIDKVVVELSTAIILKLSIHIDTEDNEIRMFVIYYNGISIEKRYVVVSGEDGTILRNKLEVTI